MRRQSLLTGEAGSGGARACALCCRFQQPLATTERHSQQPRPWGTKGWDFQQLSRDLAEQHKVPGDGTHV
eukprot:1161537-Pelagomonas_calceolata.AAC.2